MATYKDVTLQSKDGSTNYYPRTEASLVVDAETKKTVKEQLDTLGSKVDGIEVDEAELDDDNAIVVTADDGDEVVRIDKYGVNAKNLKSNDKDVLTEHQDISELTTKVEDISVENQYDDEESIEFRKANGELVGRIDDNGADFIKLTKGGKNLVTEEEFTPMSGDVAGLKAITQDISTEGGDDEEEILIRENGNVIIKFGSYGIKTKGIFDLEGNPINGNVLKIDYFTRPSKASVEQIYFATTSRTFRKVIATNADGTFDGSMTTVINVIDGQKILFRNEYLYWSEEKKSICRYYSRHKIDMGAVTLKKNVFQAPVYPVLWGVLYDTTKTAEKGYRTAHPIPILWLYYDKDNPTDIYISNGVADELEKLFVFDSSKVGGLLPTDFSPIITKDGDIICVARAERNLSRRNPYIFKHSDYDNPIELNVEGKPMGWFANLGMYYDYENNYAIFGEYARPQTEPAKVWKVTYPFDDTDNWKVVINTSGSGEGTRDVEHFHSVNVDMYSGRLYIASGDTESESKIWESSDDGDSWSVVLENNNNACRALNLIFTPYSMIYGSDENTSLYIVRRDSNGIVDFATLKEIVDDVIDDKSRARTYYSVLLDTIGCVMFLPRHDGETEESATIRLYSIADDFAEDLYMMKSVGKMTGFRCDAVNVYQSMSEQRIVCGFGNIPNYNDMIGNIGDSIGQINNLTIKVL